MHYHVGRNSQQLGVFSGDEIRAGLTKGSFYSTDLAWSEGMSGWKRLDEVFGPLPKPAEHFSASVLTLHGQTSAQAHGRVMPTPGTAVASLVLGIISLVTCYFGIFFAIPGVICGHIALSEIKQSEGRQEGRGLAIAGLVLNYIWVGLILLVLLCFLFIGGLAAVASKP